MALALVWASLLLLLLLLPTVVTGQVASCPALVVTAKAQPLRARKPGKSFAIYAKVSNVQSTPLSNVSLRMTVPLSATLKPSQASSKRWGSKSTPLVASPSVYWQGFSLAPGEGRVFKLTGKLSKCNQPGLFDVDVAAYMANPDCSSTLGTPIKVGLCACARRGFGGEGRVADP